MYWLTSEMSLVSAPLSVRSRAPLCSLRTGYALAIVIGGTVVAVLISGITMPRTVTGAMSSWKVACRCGALRSIECRSLIRKTLMIGTVGVVRGCRKNQRVSKASSEELQKQRAIAAQRPRCGKLLAPLRPRVHIGQSSAQPLAGIRISRGPERSGPSIVAVGQPDATLDAGQQSGPDGLPH
jgi:hypothetical protein